MGKRIKLTKTDVFLLGLTVLFVLAMALTWLLTPRQVRGGYDIGVAFDGDADRCLAVDEQGNLYFDGGVFPWKLADDFDEDKRWGYPKWKVLLGKLTGKGRKCD